MTWGMIISPALISVPNNDPKLAIRGFEFPAPVIDAVPIDVIAIFPDVLSTGVALYNATVNTELVVALIATLPDSILYFESQ